MGHIIGKENIYTKLGQKIDSLQTRAPWSKAFYEILKELYSTEEADVVVKMPFGLSTIDRIAKITKYEKSRLRRILDELCFKGLVMDLWANDDYYYSPSPFVIGIFEFTMMRTGDHLNTRKWAHLFDEYMHKEGLFYKANLEDGQKVSPLRTLPHEEAISDSHYLEILDYEKATFIVEESDRFSIGICSCRHEKLHLDQKECDTPLNTCSSFGFAADYLIRRNLAKEVSKSEMLENVARSKELGLVFEADNIQRNVTFICHCCKCCCNALAGISRHGYPNTVVTSSFIAEVDESKCAGCGKCAKACPINAIEMVPIDKAETKKKKKKQSKIDTSICLGCGVCALQCETEALRLVKRKQRVIPPETTFERLILACLERDNLQYLLFDNPQSVTQKYMRGFVGGFLKLPSVKKALMSDMLRSRFLAALRTEAELQGKAWLTEM
ncbi:MAG: 4Fe-4S binding protein [Deltaproteobacteria bacterium]|nr:4Fe-4S binding protein [Deltaproteobacteria bacterium]